MTTNLNKIATTIKRKIDKSFGYKFDKNKSFFVKIKNLEFSFLLVLILILIVWQVVLIIFHVKMI